MEQFERTMQLDNRIILPVFGQFDANIKKIERAFEVRIVNRGAPATCLISSGSRTSP